MLLLRKTIAILFCCLVVCEAVDGRSPNVLLIYTDDQGSVDANCYGSQDLVTPTFDRLAEEGLRFTQMYAPSAICSASRAGLLTGRFPARAGVPGNVSSTQGVAGMPTDELTLAELLKSQGYVTGHVGKWHLGYTPETMPNGQGFDSSFGHMGGCIDNYSHFFYWQGPNRHDLWRDGQEVHRAGAYFLDLMVEEGSKFLENNRDRPFFLYWAINAPHYPMQGADNWREYYQDLPSPRRQYAAFLSTVDEKIGKLLEVLDRLKLRENTLVIVQSDHGHSTEERAFWGGGSSGPYRGAKACLFEGGIRVPAFVSMPGTIPQGEVREQLVTGCDWYPTIAELCGIPLPNRHYDGRSIVPVLKDRQARSPHASFFWLLGNGKNAQWAVRKGPWKLLGNAIDRSDRRGEVKLAPRFLTNLSLDLGEQANLAQEYPDVLSELDALATQYQQGLAESDNPAGDQSGKE
ncbi:MAG: sulfatase-like hydrolase/transferase [bacterium]|nr:sulfatase-like hydrolase/transferase [bacterium]